MLLGLVDPLNPGTLSTWIADDDVRHLHDALLGAREPIRSQSWIEWLERRYTLSAAETLLAAVTAGDGSVDVDNLSIDLDPSDVGGFYISEQSPGGTGQIEALSGDLIERPERLPMALADGMRPTDLELMDEQLRAVIDSPDPTVREGLERLASSWRSGHEAARRATADLDRALDSAGLTLEHPAKTALSTRLAGPGASPQLLDEVMTWLHVRDDAKDASGMAIEPRTLAALVASRSEADPLLHLDRPSDAQRSRAIANVLWPWGRVVAPTGSFNPYAVGLTPSMDLLRQYWRTAVSVLEFSTWNDELRAELHRLLLERSELVLRACPRHSANRAEVCRDRPTDDPGRGRPAVVLPRSARSSPAWHARRGPPPAEGDVVNRVIRKSQSASVSEAADLPRRRIQCGTLLPESLSLAGFSMDLRCRVS